VSETKFQVLVIFKKNSISGHQCFLVFNAVFHVRWTNIIALK